MFLLAETTEKNVRKVFFAPKCWNIDNILYWPKDDKKVSSFRKQLKYPEIGWKKIPIFKILKNDIRKHFSKHFIIILEVFLQCYW